MRDGGFASSSSSSMRSMAVSQAHNTALSPFTVSLSPLSVAPSSLSHAGSVTRPATPQLLFGLQPSQSVHCPASTDIGGKDVPT